MAKKNRGSSSKKKEIYDYTQSKDGGAVFKLEFEKPRADVLVPKRFLPEKGGTEGANNSRIEITTFSATETLAAIDNNVDLKSILNVTVKNFVLVRDFLGLQLDFALGNLDEETFNKEKGVYISEFDSMDRQEVKSALKSLLKYVEFDLSGDDLCGILNCSEESLNQAISEIEKELEE